MSSFDSGLCLQLGLPHQIEHDCALTLKDLIGVEAVRFFLTGAQATQAAISIGLNYSRRFLVAKAQGGWHGANPWSLQGVKYPHGIHYAGTDFGGAPSGIEASTILYEFNNCDNLEVLFHTHGNNLGVLIVEPVLGNCGMIPATREFLNCCRDLASEYGVILIFDEIVTGFRVAPTTMGRHIYKIEPDIVVVGKIIGGGMPLSAIGGRSELFNEGIWKRMLSPMSDGGTFSGHPLTLQVANRFLTFLRDNAVDIYPEITRRARRLQRETYEIYSSCGIEVDIPLLRNLDGIDFPIASLRLISDLSRYVPSNPISHWDKESVLHNFRDSTLRMCFILNGILPWQGIGCVVATHSDEDIDNHLIATRAVVNQLDGVLD